MHCACGGMLDHGDCPVAKIVARSSAVQKPESDDVSLVVQLHDLVAILGLAAITVVHVCNLQK